MTQTPIVHGSIISPFVRKTVLTLNYKNIPHQLNSLNPFKKEDKEFILTLNPIGKVPIYQEGEFILSDSSVICAYLEKISPERSIYPMENRDFAKSLWFEEYGDTQLLPALNTLFFNTVLAPLLNIPSSHEVIKETLDITLPRIFDYLNSEVKGAEFILENQLSIADITIGQMALIKFDFTELNIDLSKWKRLASYIDYIANNTLFNNLFMQAKTRLNTALKQPANGITNE